MTTPAGWYPDPSNAQRARWWDGAQWTENYSDPYSPGAVLTAPEGTATNTVWIWLIIVLPLLPILSLLTIDWSPLLDYSAYSSGNPSVALNAQLAFFLSPGYLGAMIGGWIVYGLNAFFAYRDGKFLERAGVPRPFHFAWVFLSSLVYVIGRAVVVKRRTGHGSAILWAAIGSIVLSFILTFVMVGMMAASILSRIPPY